MKPTKRYAMARFDEIAPNACPCGWSKRAFLDGPAGMLSAHVVTIKADSLTHYHRRQTELYYILKGRGHMELDGERLPVAAGDAILIKPGCRHRAVGALTLLNVVLPAFDPRDEHFE